MRRMSAWHGGPPNGPEGSYGPPEGSPAPHGTPPDVPRQPAGPPPQRPPGPQGSPDWAALADETAARARRRKWLLFGGGLLGVAAVAAVVATAVVSSDSGTSDHSGASSLPSAETLPSESGTPEPSFSDVAPPAPPDPKEFISSATKDTAPLSADTLFAETRANSEGRAYQKATTAGTTACASATQGPLGGILTEHGCRSVYRATYTADGVAVTVGVAVFDDAATAAEVKSAAKGNIASLSGGGVPTFCRATACRLTTNAVGRYAYFTVAGYTSGKAVTADDTAALRGARDVADYTFHRIWARGTAQASAYATRHSD